MRPRDGQRLLDAMAALAPSSKVFPRKRDLAGEVWAALMKAGEASLAADVMDAAVEMRKLQVELSDEAWREHELEISWSKLPEPAPGGVSLTDVVGDRVFHILLEENHGGRSGDATLELPGDRTYSGTWSVGKAGPEHGGASVLRLDIPGFPDSDVAAIAQALVEGIPGLADTYQYP